MFRYLFALILLCLTTLPAQADTCVYGPLPAIAVTTSESEPRFAYNLSQAQLKKFRGNADIPASAIYDLTVNAMSTGKMRVTPSLKFVASETKGKQSCVQVSEIKVHIHIDPVIYIAKELRNKACEYKEYLVHELKHVEEDRRLINDYKTIIDRNMAFAFPAVKDYSAGPLPPSLIKEAQQSLDENVTGALQATVNSMLRERRDRQRAIDSTGEYRRLTLACTGGSWVKPKTVKP